MVSNKKPGMWKRILIASVAIAAIGAAGIFLGLRYAIYYPNTIVEGENTCWLGRFNPSEDGFGRLREIVDRSVGMPPEANVAFFEANLDREGCVISFTLSFEAFDTEGLYVGNAIYTYGNRSLVYSPPVRDSTSLVHHVNPNSDLEYLGEQVRKIPLGEQVRQSGLDRYAIRYQPHTLVEEGTPIFDGRNGAPFSVLGPADYNIGAGGLSDGETNVVFLLYDGQSMVGGQMYWYVCEPADPAMAVGDPVAFMECDYYIDNGRLRFMRNYGQDVIDTDITPDELDETMEFYRNGLLLPPSSFFISPDPAFPLAYFYGGAPTLKISADNGTAWDTVAFPASADFGRSITKRVIGFATPRFGYAALGTDWSMGGGEHKMCYFSFDGGKSWEERALPLTMTSSTLMDMAMADEENGVVALSDGMEGYFPQLYGTEDTGESWVELRLTYDGLPAEVQYLSHIDSLVYEDGAFVLTLGQGDSGTAKVVFSADHIGDKWEYAGMHNGTIHTVG